MRARRSQHRACARGDVGFSAPILSRGITGQRVPVDGKFVLAGPDTVTFQVAACDPRQSLIIDHTLTYAGYVGGRSRHDGGAIAMGSTGAAYVTGSAGSTGATLPSRWGRI